MKSVIWECMVCTHNTTHSKNMLRMHGLQHNTTHGMNKLRMRLSIARVKNIVMQLDWCLSAERGKKGERNPAHLTHHEVRAVLTYHNGWLSRATARGALPQVQQASAAADQPSCVAITTWESLQLLDVRDGLIERFIEHALRLKVEKQKYITPADLGV